MKQKQKTRVGILFGGKSAEHEVSLQSAKNVAAAINQDKYETLLIGIDKSGKWLLPDQAQFLLHNNDPKLIQLNHENSSRVTLIPGSGGELINLDDHNTSLAVDVMFPILHGPFGEDGTIQGLLKLANIPFVGAGVLGSAVGMDKDIMKRLLRDAGIPIGKFIAREKGDKIDYTEIVDNLGLPCFVKPANLGSSVGVRKVTDKSTFEEAVQTAFLYDTKILIEEFIDGRELECAILGNQSPLASGVGEVKPTHDLYSYEAKYIDEQGAVLTIPAAISEEVAEQVRELAIKTFKTLAGTGLARVDCFLTKDNRVLVNEINTIPGFTKISMYPQLWSATGIGYSELIDRLIQLAFERFKDEGRLTSRTE